MATLTKKQLQQIIREEFNKPSIGAYGEEVGTNVKKPSEADPNYVIVKCVNSSLKMLREIKKTLSGAIEGIDFIVDDEEDTTYDDIAREVEASVKKLYELMGCGY